VINGGQTGFDLLLLFVLSLHKREIAGMVALENPAGPLQGRKPPKIENG